MWTKYVYKYMHSQIVSVTAQTESMSLLNSLHLPKSLAEIETPNYFQVREQHMRTPCVQNSEFRENSMLAEILGLFRVLRTREPQRTKSAVVSNKRDSFSKHCFAWGTLPLSHQAAFVYFSSRTRFLFDSLTLRVWRDITRRVQIIHAWAMRSFILWHPNHYGIQRLFSLSNCCLPWKARKKYI